MDKEQIAKELVDLTIEYTDMYFDATDKKSIDKQMWAALHIGFAKGLTLNGYSEDVVFEGAEIARNKLTEMGFGVNK